MPGSLKRLDISRQFSAEGGQTKGQTLTIVTPDVGKLSRAFVYSVSAPVNNFEIIQNLLISRAQRSNGRSPTFSRVDLLIERLPWEVSHAFSSKSQWKQSYDSHCFYTHTIWKTNSSKNLFEENIRDFKSRLRIRGYPDLLVNNVLTEVQFTDRKSALRQKQIMRKKILPFVTQHHPSVPNLKNLIKWHLIENQPLLKKFIRIQENH